MEKIECHSDEYKILVENTQTIARAFNCKNLYSVYDPKAKLDARVQAHLKELPGRSTLARLGPGKTPVTIEFVEKIARFYNHVFHPTVELTAEDLLTRRLSSVYLPPLKNKKDPWLFGTFYIYYYEEQKKELVPKAGILQIDSFNKNQEKKVVRLLLGVTCHKRLLQARSAVFPTTDEKRARKNAKLPYDEFCLFRASLPTKEKSVYYYEGTLDAGLDVIVCECVKRYESSESGTKPEKFAIYLFGHEHSQQVHYQGGMGMAVSMAFGKDSVIEPLKLGVSAYVLAWDTSDMRALLMPELNSKTPFRIPYRADKDWYRFVLDAATE